MSLEIIILAAGQGTRMCSTLPKVLHQVAGHSMLSHVIRSARQLKPSRIHIVIGYGADVVHKLLAADDLNFVLQEQQLGTGHATAQATPFISADNVLILYGDVPLIEVRTLRRLLKHLVFGQIGLLTVVLDDPTGYGRIIRDIDGKVVAIVEQKDTCESQRMINEINTGIFAVPANKLANWISRLSNNNVQGEYYVTDVIKMAVSDGWLVATEQPYNSMEVYGVNDRKQLARLERHYQLRAGQHLMAQGVTLLDPARFDVRGEVTVGRDVLIDINVILEGRVIIEDNVVIGPNCIIKDSTLRKGVVVKANSYLEGAVMGEDSEAGPFMRLRFGSVLGARAQVGNFVELKNTYLGEGTKVNHLTYLGDAFIGARTNIGAGTITCNFDGAKKHQTVLGEDVFIGANNSLVAPLRVGDGATTAAGSTINQDVDNFQLGVARASQRNINGWKRPVKTKKT
ncbi:bifunctional UDP-N-acetylglucosamine diphosphorylase/glucosamine-1-phosphate N-acetyltransferase GlmU [Candidatus Pseudomonas adelgestsugas]|uniref:Bifunctional protein GlmU n=1 Tax=Candidatus Pseudomonas adelgestsugas TaxID=1302376 RepID=A0ABX5R7S9_9PSED|nr:bifunctional UDP-N-acetylglucosamine diphosphorylase/glucosamine-1-phosphate N-acetyltransferase GlmU [Candidatus Pseudomonas adelgestsugas]QAX81388.1 Bifunctional protein GlmU [Candidatus Pseudomonas adelgestsugas]